MIACSLVLSGNLMQVQHRRRPRAESHGHNAHGWKAEYGAKDLQNLASYARGQ
eukprot:CAMPEP_0115435636 /NCGR_PEP_ID=MMETSP0271-20121206/33768_1 /TAXON_ID=71861 /ORGANISM="Scrippsiella trochoidea, Strain CCMP3099" /LENGTH=52 /DNA_ID=CAMNT_0002861113 /DNA_START=910 /DNA_END=1065 /DNA_ORIENTATION=-